MKTPITVLFFVTMICSNLFSQTEKQLEEIQNNYNIDSTEAKIYKTYYFHDKSVDSTIFCSGNINLYQQNENPENPRLELYSDSNFRFFYHLKSKPFQDTDSVARQQTTIEILDGDEITGRYGILQISSSLDERKDIGLTMMFKNGDTINYDILYFDEHFTLIKQ